jgi:hypothetical protein
MICDDSESERPGKKIRPGCFVASADSCATITQAYARIVR